MFEDTCGHPNLREGKRRGEITTSSVTHRPRFKVYVQLMTDTSNQPNRSRMDGDREGDYGRREAQTIHGGGWVDGET